MAYSQEEIFEYRVWGRPKYPRELARVRIYKTKIEQLNCFTNTSCSASQCFEADSIIEVEKIIQDFNENFENENWLKENIYPYI